MSGIDELSKTESHSLSSPVRVWFSFLLIFISFSMCSEKPEKIEDKESVSDLAQRIKKDVLPESVPFWYKRVNGEVGIVTVEAGELKLYVIKKANKP